jgi:AcrR family transcriptional regulator
MNGCDESASIGILHCALDNLLRRGYQFVPYSIVRTVPYGPRQQLSGALMSNEEAAPSRKDGKRAEILRIARELFFREGYAGTSMSQIAATLGGSKTTLYYHFQSKEDLLLAVVEEIVETKPDDYDLTTEPLEFRAWLHWFGLAAMKKITSQNFISFQRLAAAEALRFPEIGRAFYETGRPGMQMGAERFAEAMAKRVLRKADPMVAVEHFLELCAGWMLRRVIWNIQPPPTEEEIAANVRKAVDAFMDGYSAKSKS